MMKKSSIQIPYGAEKLEFLRQYIEAEKLQADMESLLQTLYEKHVPAEVRETIDKKKEGNPI